MDLAFPFAGRWLVRNSPADRVPSHGTELLATAQAIDFVPVDEVGTSAPMGFDSWFVSEPPERFSGFGRELLAPVSGTVVSTHDGEEDHRAHRGLPSIRHALGQADRAREGWLGLAGNHIMIESEGAIVVLCHLRRGSVAVRPGQQVRAGELVGACGNSGNSTEPHVHVQIMDARDPEAANPVPLTFAGGLPRNGEVIEV